MKNLFIILFVSVIGALTINSCSEDAAKPSETKDYFPASNGDYWIYNSMYKEDGADKTATDSTAVVGSETVKAQTAMKYNSYINMQLFESYFRYSANGKLYALPSEMFPKDIKDLLPTVVLPEDWVVIADANSASWTMFTFNVENIPLPVDGFNLTLNGVVTITGNKGGTMSFDVNGKNYSSQEFITKITFNGTVKYNGFDFPFSFGIDSKSYYADNVGLIKTETAEQSITFQSFPIYKVEANSRMLLRFKVAEKSAAN